MTSKLEKLSKSLKKGSKTISKLNAQAEDARNAAYLKAIRKHSKLIYEVADELLPDEDEEDDEEEEEEESGPEGEGETPSKRKARERLDAIKAGNKAPENIVHLRDHTVSFQAPKAKSYPSAEDDSLRRLFYGYEDITADRINTIFANVQKGPGTDLDAHITKLHEAMDGKEGNEKIESLEKFLYDSRKAEGVDNYIAFVIQCIHCLQITYHYGNSNRTQKGQIAAKLFETFQADEYRVTRLIANPEQRQAALAGGKAKFKNKYEKMVSSRNWTMRLYLMASRRVDSPILTNRFPQFGDAIFLDPLWLPSVGLDRTPRSKEFGALMDLAQGFPKEAPAGRSTMIFDNLLTILGGEELKDWVRGQLEQLEEDNQDDHGLLDRRRTRRFD